MRRPRGLARWVIGTDGELYKRRRDGTYRLPDGVYIRGANVLCDETPLWDEPLLFIRNQWRRLKRWLTKA